MAPEGALSATVIVSSASSTASSVVVTENVASVSPAGIVTSALRAVKSALPAVPVLVAAVTVTSVVAACESVTAKSSVSPSAADASAIETVGGGGGTSPVAGAHAGLRRRHRARSAAPAGSPP